MSCGRCFRPATSWSASAAKIENEIRGLLKTFGVMFGKKVGFARRAEEIVSGELAAAPEIKAVVEAMMESRRPIIERIRCDIDLMHRCGTHAAE